MLAIRDHGFALGTGVVVVAEIESLHSEEGVQKRAIPFAWLRVGQILPTGNCHFVVLMLDYVILVNNWIKTDSYVVGQVDAMCDLLALTALDLIEQVESKYRLNGHQFLKTQQLLNLTIPLDVPQ